MKIIVAQFGARHRYQIPRIFEKAGILAALFTDSSSESYIGKIIKVILGIWKSEKLGRIYSRKIDGISKDKIYSLDYSLDLDILNRKKYSHVEYILKKSNRLSRVMKKISVAKEADALFVMYNELCDFVGYAKSNGLKIFVDIYISPLTYEIINKEIDIFKFDEKIIKKYDVKSIIKSLERNIQNADLILCPSKWVADGVLKYFPQCNEKIRIIPYGCSLTNNSKGKPLIRQKGRFLFVGNDPIRKGLHYLAQAAQILTKKYQNFDFRIAGQFDDNIINNSLFSSLNFIGKLDKNELAREYLSAQGFVFPSLSEGFASVIIEAMSYGLPVITTSESGAEINNNINGIIIKSRSVTDLVNKIEEFYLDENLQTRLSTNSLILANNYSIDAWNNRLIEVING